MKYINNWKSNAKKWDIIEISFRLGKVTFIRFSYSISKNKFILTLLNFSVKN